MNQSRFSSLLSAWWPWLAAAGSGFLMTAAYPPYHQDWLIWISLTPLLCALWFSRPWVRREWLRAALLGYVAGACFFLTTFFWIRHAALAAVFFLPPYLALYPALWALYAHYAAHPRADVENPWLRSKHNLALAFRAAVGWVALEWVRGWMFSGFGWNGLGVALHKNIALIQFTDLTGVGGLSFLIVLANVIAVATVRRMIDEFRVARVRPHFDFSITLALVAAAFTYGLRESLQKTETVPLKVAAVQANIPIDAYRAAGWERDIMQAYREQTDVALLLDPDLLVWPEAAMPRAVYSHPEIHDFVMSYAAALRGDFLQGTVHFAEEGDYNSVLLLAEDGEPQFQHKMHLVPFGEFVPFRHSFPLFAWIVGDLVPSDFDAGKEPVILHLSKGIRVGALVCFEDTLGELVRKFALRGAQLLVNVTNDGWFYDSPASHQHLANAVFRCAELKLPMVRAANTGVTCFIDRHGRIKSQLTTPDGSTFLAGVLSGNVDVPVEPRLTVYARVGELFSKLCALVAVMFIGQAVWRRKKTPVNSEADAPRPFDRV